MSVNTCVEKTRTLYLPQVPLPHPYLLLQGMRGFSYSSYELSSSKGVWLVRKEKKMKENGSLFDKPPNKFNSKTKTKKTHLQSVVWALYTTKNYANYKNDKSSKLLQG